MLFGKKQSLVGLDIGCHTVKVVELEPQSNKTYKLTNWGISQPLAEAIVDGEIMDRQLVTDAISNLMESRAIKAKNVVAAVSGRAVIVKKITMNKLSPDDAKQAIYWEAEQHVPYDINDVSLDFNILGDAPNDDKQMQVLLVAAKKGLVEIVGRKRSTHYQAITSVTPPAPNLKNCFSSASLEILTQIKRPIYERVNNL